MSSTPYESATLLIRLYELRREATMRDERTLYVPTGKAHVAREILRKI